MPGLSRRVALLKLALWAVVLISGPIHARDADAPASYFGKGIERISVDGSISTIVWSPDQRHLVVVAGSSMISYDLSRQSIQWKIPYHLTHDNKVAFVGAGEFLLTHSLARVHRDGLINWNLALSILDARSGTAIRHLADDAPSSKWPSRANSFDVSADGRTIAVLLGISGVAQGFAVGTWAPLWRIGGNQAAMYVALDARRDRLTFAGLWPHGPVRTWDLRSKRRLSEFQTYKTGLKRMLLHEATGNIVTGGDGGLYPNQPPIPGRTETFAGIEDDPATLVRAWDPIEGRLLRTFLGPGRNVNSLALSPDGRYLMAAKSRAIQTHANAYVLAWEFATGRLIAASSYGQGLPEVVSFSPDGRRIAIGADGSIQIIELDPKLFP